MRESVGERGVSVQKPKNCVSILWPMGGPCRAAIVGRRGLICDGRFESEGITGRPNHEGHRRPGQTYNRSSRIRNGSRLRPNGYGQVTTALRRSRTLGLPYRRRQSAVFRRGGASQRPTGAPPGYANTRFTVAQNAQDSNRVVDTAGNLVMSDKTAFGEGPIQWN